MLDILHVEKEVVIVRTRDCGEYFPRPREPVGRVLADEIEEVLSLGTSNQGEES